MEAPSIRQISRTYWWLLVIRAIFAVLFGILAIIAPLVAALFFIFLFGAYALFDGILSIVVSLQERHTYSRWWMLLISGIAAVILGIFAFFQPGVTAVALFWIVALWLIISGIFEILAAFALRGLGIEWVLVISGILSIIVGIVFFAHPVASILTIVWLIGVFSLVHGVMLLIRAIRLRSLLTA